MNKDHLVCRERLIVALSIFNDRKNGNEYFLRGIETAKEIVKSAPIEDCVPLNAILKLRDWLYESDAITMNGVKQINQLISEYSGKPIPKVETGYEQEWISVYDRLPEKDGAYLVTTNGVSGLQNVKTRWFAKDGEMVEAHDLAGQKDVWYLYDIECGYVSIKTVTHWMPLPQPPKGE